MEHLFKASLVLMYQGMGAIFTVIFLLYLILLLFTKLFSRNSE
ncbi:MAG: hypothetical protein ACOX0W_02585 [Sphaerochaetaceae bacterium]